MLGFTYGPLQTLVLLGASPAFPAIVKALAGKLHVVIITAPDQAHEIADCGDAHVLVTETLDTSEVEAAIWEAGVGRILSISFGARWIFKRTTITDLFNGKLLNAHGTRLPLDRGGGGWSWRIMRGDRLGAVTLHIPDDGIDTGPIVMSKPYVVPAACRTPTDMIADYTERLTEEVIAFVAAGLDKTVTLPVAPQPDALSIYYPRLSTNIHGWIDWTMEPHALERFSLAFDEPYPGASTMLGDTQVRLKGCHLTASDVGHHPFQCGLVTRVADDHIIVALAGSWSLIVPINKKQLTVRAGDRFVTPLHKLESAKTSRITYGATGIKSFN